MSVEARERATVAAMMMKTRLSVTILYALLGGLLAPSLTNAQPDELDAYLSARRRILEDPARPMEERERTALEMAAALDRNAGQAATAENARDRWSQAAAILETFNTREPKHPQATTFAAQAAIYRWAIGQSWAERSATNPTDVSARERAVRALDAAIATLQPLAETTRDGPLAEDLHYRLARALADRARLEPEDSDARRTRLEQALKSLSNPIDAPRLKGFADLLRAELLTQLGRFDDAEQALDAVEHADPAPMLPKRIEARVTLRLGQGRFGDAEQALAKLPEDSAALREGLALDIALARWQADREPGPREQAEADAFRHVERLREQGGPAARLALLKLARVITEPGVNRSPEQAALLAEGALAQGELERASRLYQDAADRAEARDRPKQAASLRLNAASVLFRDDQLEPAARLFAELARNPDAGPIRPRAALLHALTIGRDRERRQPGFDLGRYIKALAIVVRDFPESSEASEARWFLGQARLESSDRAGATQAWEAIPRDHPRWLAARLALAALKRDAAESAIGSADPEAVRRAVREAREALEAINSQLPADDTSGRADVALARAELESLPDAGEPSRALAILDRLLSRPLDDSRRARARRLRVVALSELGRYLDAEGAARSLLESQSAADMLVLAQRLDRAAASASSDLARRRFGELLRLIAGSLRERPEGLSSPERAEARLRLARAELFRGDPPAARHALRDWPEALDELSPKLWPELAELAIEASDFDRAIDTYRRIARGQPPGTAAWFRARYGHALALEGAGHPDLARQLIDATAALHPDLGGPPIQARFEALRKRLGQP